MPLGQSPFGSRPEPEQPPSRGPSWLGGRRWLLWLMLASAVMMAGMSFFGPKRKPGDVRECLTDRVCESGQRCLVKPKGDGFPSMGFCVKVCTTGGDCAVPLECQPVNVVEQHVEAGDDGIGPLMVCRLPVAG